MDGHATHEAELLQRKRHAYSAALGFLQREIAVYNAYFSPCLIVDSELAPFVYTAFRDRLMKEDGYLFREYKHIIRRMQASVLAYFDVRITAADAIGMVRRVLRETIFAEGASYHGPAPAPAPAPVVEDL